MIKKKTRRTEGAVRGYLAYKEPPPFRTLHVGPCLGSYGGASYKEEDLGDQGLDGVLLGHLPTFSRVFKEEW